MKFKMLAGIMVLFMFLSVIPNVLQAQEQEEETEPVANTPPTDQMTMELQMGGTEAEDEFFKNVPVEDAYWGVQEGDKWKGKVLPSCFRGTCQDTINVLENLQYFSYEHTPFFAENVGDIEGELGGTADPQFVGDPMMDWPLTEEGEEGWKFIPDDSGKNLARRSSEFNDPGSYVLTNSGARQVSFPVNVPPMTEDDEDEDDEEAERSTTTITAVGSMDVIAHDVTPPDVWVAVIEKTAEDAGQDFLKKNLKSAMIAQSKEARGGHIVPALPLRDILKFPDSDPSPVTLAEDLYKQASVLAAFEYPQNAPPRKKKSAVVTYGNLFVSNDASEFQSEVHSSSDLTRKTIASLSSSQAIKVRKGVPFFVAAATSDNTYNRKLPADEWPFYPISESEAAKTGNNGYCIYSDNAEANQRIVRCEEGSYMFRLPNYPREEYPNQPEYFLAVNQTDPVGNLITLKIPVYIEATRAYYEGGIR